MDEYDLFDSELDDGEEDRILARMRREDPVHWDEKYQWWLITRQSEMREVAKDASLFSVEPKGPQAFIESHFSFEALDGPEHNRARAAVAVGFKARAINRLEGKLVDFTDRAIDQVISQGHCDFARDIAWPVPIQVIAAMLGFDNVDLLMRYAVAFDRLFTEGEEALEDPELGGQFAAVVAEFTDYVESLVAERRKNPQEDLISNMLSMDDPEIFTSFQRDAPIWCPQGSDGVMGFIFFLLGAGAETTRHSISLGLLALLENPDQMERLAANPELMPQATQEILRWTAPSRVHRRVVMRDTELHDKKLAAGDSVLMLWPSANRDEAVFEDPFEFQIDRKPNNHLTFGLGPHFCLGSKLAALEVEGVIRRVLERLKEIRLAPDTPLVRLKMPMVRGLKHLPVEFRAAE